MSNAGTVVRRRRVSWVVMVTVASVMLAACAPTTAPSTTAPGAPGSARAAFSPACTSAGQRVSIDDPALARTVLSSLGYESADRAELACSEMARLTEVTASRVESIAGLEFAINLNRLTLRDSPLSSLDPLTGMQRLTTVVVTGGHLTSIDVVATLPSLSVLDISGSDVSDLSPLAASTQLTYLVAPGNAISDLAVLAGMRDLFWLELTDNDVVDLSPLQGLTRLSTLKLSGNQVSDAGPLAGLTRLRRLELQGNQLTDVDFVERLELQVLLLADNRITSVRGLARNPSLSATEPYDLRNNCIDLASDDPFVQDLLERGTGLLLEPQNASCVAS